MERQIIGTAWQDGTASEWSRQDWQWPGRLGGEWRGLGGRWRDWGGRAGWDRTGPEWTGVARLGRLGWYRRRMGGRGQAWQEWLGSSRTGRDGRGRQARN